MVAGYAVPTSVQPMGCPGRLVASYALLGLLSFSKAGQKVVRALLSLQAFNPHTTLSILMRGLQAC